MDSSKITNSFQSTFVELCEFWKDYGCILIPPSQVEISIPILNPISFFGMVNSKKFNMMFFQSHVASKEFLDIKDDYQNYLFMDFQVIIKNKLELPQKIFLDSLSKLGFDIKSNDIIFKNEKFENFIFRINADGYRVYINGDSIAKMHYIENIGNFTCEDVPVVIVYYLDKIVKLLQNKENLWNIDISNEDKKISYGNIMFEIEKQNYDFIMDNSSNEIMLNEFENCKNLASNLLDKRIIIPAYTAILKAKYYLDILNLRGFILHNDRISYNKVLRGLVDRCCEEYLLTNKKS